MVTGKGWIGLYGALLLTVGCGGSGTDHTPKGPSGGGGAAATGAAGKGGKGGSSSSTGGSSDSAAGGEGEGEGEGEGDDSSAGTSGTSAGGKPGLEWQTTMISAPVAPRGIVDATQTTLDKVTFSYNLYAKFAMMRAQWDGCTKHQLGVCWYYECPAGSNPVGTTDDSQLISGSAVTFENATTIVALSLDGDHYHGQGEEPFWPLTGDSIFFEAKGYHPTFRIGLRTPPTVWLKSVNGQVTLTSIVRSQGATIEWETTGAGTAFFSIYRLDRPPVPAAICTFEATPGTGVLPAEVLEHLEPGSDYRLVLRGDQRAYQDVDGYALEADLFAYGMKPLMPLSLE